MVSYNVIDERVIIIIVWSFYIPSPYKNNCILEKKMLYIGINQLNPYTCIIDTKFIKTNLGTKDLLKKGFPSTA